MVQYSEALLTALVSANPMNSNYVTTRRYSLVLCHQLRASIEEILLLKINYTTVKSDENSCLPHPIFADSPDAIVIAAAESHTRAFGLFPQRSNNARGGQSGEPTQNRDDVASTVKSYE